MVNPPAQACHKVARPSRSTSHLRPRPLVHALLVLEKVVLWYKIHEYDYDLISGNVHNLYYQRGQSDQFTYHYTYDKLNRLVEVFSSEIETDHSRSNLWRRDAAYSYYDHGPLRRTIIGQDRLQGLDYAYTLQGWIKGVNGSLGVDYRDITRADINMDGFSESNYAISWLPNRDLYRYANQYFDGDYKQIGGDRVTPLYAKLPADYELFNGNIVRHFKSTLADNFHTTALVGEYDQLNRVRYGNQEFYGERPKQRLTSEGTPPGGSYLTKAVEAPSYDGNGNILHLDRWFRSADAAASTAPQQQGANNRLNYGYTPGTNLLATVDGQLASSAPTADLWQPFDFITGRHGYTYDKSGNLIRETDSEQQTGDIAINWNPYGKVTSVQTADKSTSIDEQYRTTFGYGPDQNRWAKRRLTAAPGSGRDATEATYYVRDAQGSTLATYGRSWDYDGTGGGQLEVEPFALKEQYLFGSTRLGEVAFDRPLVGVSEPPTSYGERRYELTNHLGNVTTVFSEYLTDYLDARDAPFTAPELIADRDYFAFGLGLERAENVPLIAPGIPKQSSYRFGFNGKELDDEGEWGTNQTVYDYGLRIYNPGIAKFLSVDPLTDGYAYNSPYAYAENSPVAFIDLDGAEKVYFSAGVGHDAGNSGYIERMGYAARSKGFDFTDVFAHSVPNVEGLAPLPAIPTRDAAFSAYPNGYGTTPYNEIPDAIGPLANANLPMIGSNRNQGNSGVDWRITQSQEQILSSLREDPLGPNETLTLMGGSGGSVVIAQTALKMANEGTVVDNLILLASPIPMDSRLFDAISSHDNIKRVFYIELEGDDITGIAGEPGSLHSLVSEMMRLGDYHPHKIITWSEKLPIRLFQTLEGEYDIENKGGEGVHHITIPYEEISNEQKH